MNSRFHSFWVLPRGFLFNRKNVKSQIQGGIYSVNQVIRKLLGNNADMVSLYLTHPEIQDGEQVQMANSTANDEYNYKIGGGGATPWVLFSRSRLNWYWDQNLHQHDRGHRPVHLGSPGQRAKRDHQNDPLHRGWRPCHGLWCFFRREIWNEPERSRGGKTSCKFLP